MRFDTRKIPNGAVLLMGISYDNANPAGDTRGRTSPKVFTYVLLKAGGLWYVSGTGKAPQAAAWTAVERWLDRDNRVLEWIEAVTETVRVFPELDTPAITQTRRVLDGTDQRCDPSTGYHVNPHKGILCPLAVDTLQA